MHPIDISLCLITTSATYQQPPALSLNLRTRKCFQCLIQIAVCTGYRYQINRLKITPPVIHRYRFVSLDHNFIQQYGICKRNKKYSIFYSFLRPYPGRKQNRTCNEYPK